MYTMKNEGQPLDEYQEHLLSMRYTIQKSMLGGSPVGHEAFKAINWAIFYTKYKALYTPYAAVSSKFLTSTTSLKL